MKLNKLIIAIIIAGLTLFVMGCELFAPPVAPPGTAPKEIHYDGDFYTSFYYPSYTTYESAIRLSAVKLASYKGSYIQSVRFYILNKPTSITVRVYGTNTSTVPGTVLTSVACNMTKINANSWNEVQLTNAPLVGTTDIWLSVLVTVPDASKATIGLDAGPGYTDGDFTYTNSTWQHIGFNANLNIRGVTN